MPSIQRVSGATAAAASSASEFKHFSPTNVAKTSSGYSLTGNLNRSIVADIRMSKSGDFTTSNHLWNKPAGEQKAMTKTELKALKSSLTTFLASARLTKPASDAYQAIMSGIDKAIGGSLPADPKVTKATTAKLLKSTNDALAGGKLKWNAQMPLGVRYVEVPLFSEKHPDGFSYSALIPVGALSPTAKVSDPNKATSFMIKRSGGFAGLTTYAGPVDLKK